MANNLQYVTTIMTVFSIIGILVKLILGNYQGAATAVVYGYGLVAISLIIIMFNDFALAQKENSLNSTSVYFVFKMLKSSIPTLVTFCILWWLITLNLFHFNRINENDVAKDYSTYSFISTIFILLQIFVIFKYSNSKINGDNKSNKFAPIVYVLSLINIIFVVIQLIILKFFSTDG